MVDFRKLREQAEKNKTTFYLLIAGSRGFTRDLSDTFDIGCKRVTMSYWNYAVKKLDYLLSRKVADGMKIVIIEGGAKGADALGAYYAKLRGYELKEYPADWDTFGRSAGCKRNELMYTTLSLKPNKAAILFWDGQSRGTYHNFKCAYDYGVEVRCYNYAMNQWLSKEEIEDLKFKAFKEF